MMETKMQALEKAQKKQTEIILKGGSADVVHWKSGKYFCVCGENFKYVEQKPLEKDTLCFVMLEPSKSLFLYSTGKLNEWYPGGCNSMNYPASCGPLILCDKFEVIEMPGEFERVHTTVNMCLSNRCIYLDPRMSKCLKENSHECTVLAGKPSKLKVER